MCTFFFLLTKPRKCCVGSQSLSNLPRLPYPTVYILVLRLFLLFFDSCLISPPSFQYLFFFFFNRLPVARCDPRKSTSLTFFFHYRREFLFLTLAFFPLIPGKGEARDIALCLHSRFSQEAHVRARVQRNHPSFLHVLCLFSLQAFTNLLYKLLLRPNSFFLLSSHLLHLVVSRRCKGEIKVCSFARIELSSRFSTICHVFDIKVTKK